MDRVEVAVIGTGWCGGIRAETLSRSALVDRLHICEIRPDRLAEMKALTTPASATLDYRDIDNKQLLVEQFTAGGGGSLTYTFKNPGSGLQPPRKRPS